MRCCLFVCFRYERERECERFREMSGKSGSNNGAKGNNGTSSIPSSTRKMVQSLKEIVNNYTEQEIYAMLKDCNMDPNETVNRLLTQGLSKVIILYLFLGFSCLDRCDWVFARVGVLFVFILNFD